MPSMDLSYCLCVHACCPLYGCCLVTSGQKGPITSSPPRRRPIQIQKTHAVRATSGKSFLDLPAELRNRIYELVLVFDEVISISMDITSATIPNHRPWAIMATCRELYHQAAPMYYGANTFQIFRGYPRDFSIPKSLNLPFHLFRNLVLLYPHSMAMGSRSYLSHAWSHFVSDAHRMTSKFRHLDKLQLSLQYYDGGMVEDAKMGSWDDILERPAGISDAEQARRVRRVIRGLNRVEGRRMPACVSFLIQMAPLQDIPYVRNSHDLECLNHGLRLAASPS